MSVLAVQLLSKNATLPTRGSANSAGCDLYAAHDAHIPAGGMALVNTDIAVAVPQGCYGRVAPRSSLALRGIGVGAGVVDADYRGPIKVVLFNHGPDGVDINQGHRVAQLVLERIKYATPTEVPCLPQTVRGVGGFGSTGV